MSELLTNGTFRARAIKPSGNAWGRSSNGNEQLAITFVLLSGPDEGAHLTRYFSFTQNASEYSIDALFCAGWDGADIVDLNGIGDKECSVVLQDETYNDKTTTRIKYVNDTPGGQKDPMDIGSVKSLDARLRGQVLAVKERRGAKAVAASASASLGNDDVGF